MIPRVLHGLNVGVGDASHLATNRRGYVGMAMNLGYEAALWLRVDRPESHLLLTTWLVERQCLSGWPSL